MDSYDDVLATEDGKAFKGLDYGIGPLTCISVWIYQLDKVLQIDAGNRDVIRKILDHVLFDMLRQLWNLYTWNERSRISCTECGPTDLRLIPGGAVDNEN